MQVRPADKNKDSEVIVRFQLRLAIESEGFHLDPLVTEKGVNAVFNDAAKGQYYVCEDQGKVIASMLTMPEWSDWRNRTVLWIHSVYVMPDARKKGAFKFMYQFLQEKVKASDAFGGLRLYVDKRNFNAQAVYHRLGMSNQHYELFEWLK